MLLTMQLFPKIEICLSKIMCMVVYHFVIVMITYC